MAAPFSEPPPKPLSATVQRFYANGTPTVPQVDYENALYAYLKRWTGGGPKLSGLGLPTANPHVVGQIYSNAGVLTVSAG